MSDIRVVRFEELYQLHPEDVVCTLVPNGPTVFDTEARSYMLPLHVELLHNLAQWLETHPKCLFKIRVQVDLASSPHIDEALTEALMRVQKHPAANVVVGV